jgi:hypothetical protein
MEEEVRDILREAANREPEPNRGGLGTTISGLFAKVGLHSEIPELRGHEVTPVTFD